MNNGSQKAKDKYLKEKVDTFVLRVPKGEKEIIQQHAQSMGKSLNSYIVDLIKADVPALWDRRREVTAAVKRSSLPSFLD